MTLTITRVRLQDFKNFQDASLTVGAFTVLVGTNASGKSNIRDAFRFLHGIGRGYSLADIMGGRYGPGGRAEWAQMRGAANEIIRFGENSFAISVNYNDSRYGALYHIEIEMTKETRFRVISESLTHLGLSIYDSHPGAGDPVDAQDDETHLTVRMGKIGDQRKYGHKFLARPDQPALSQIAEFRNAARSQKEAAQAVLDLFASIRFLDLVPELMRLPAFPGQTVLGDSGENLPTVLQSICDRPERKAVLMEWVRELTPMDVTDFAFPRDPTTGLVQLVIQESNGRQVSGYSASDGTLRFLAMLAALLGEHPARVFFFEEIDNGIHPSRLRLLLDLIERQTAKGDTQVVTTTHSPDLLSMVSDTTFESASVVYRAPGAKGAVIRRIADLPNATKLRASQGLGRLHASGWMEDMLSLEDYNDAAE